MYSCCLNFPLGGHVKYKACFIKLLSLDNSRHVTGLFCIIWIVWITDTENVKMCLLFCEVFVGHERLAFNMK